MDEKGTRPHIAVLNVMVEVHSLLDSGECSGNVVNEATLGEYGIKPAFLLRVEGFDRHDCLMKLKEKLKVFKD